MPLILSGRVSDPLIALSHFSTDLPTTTKAQLAVQLRVCSELWESGEVDDWYPYPAQTSAAWDGLSY